jgi:hypothetical protein
MRRTGILVTRIARRLTLTDTIIVRPGAASLSVREETAFSLSISTDRCTAVAPARYRDACTCRKAQPRLVPSPPAFHPIPFSSNSLSITLTSTHPNWSRIPDSHAHLHHLPLPACAPNPARTLVLLVLPGVDCQSLVHHSCPQWRPGTLMRIVRRLPWRMCPSRATPANPRNADHFRLLPPALAGPNRRRFPIGIRSLDVPHAQSANDASKRYLSVHGLLRSICRII